MTSPFYHRMQGGMAMGANRPGKIIAYGRHKDEIIAIIGELVRTGAGYYIKSPEWWALGSGYLTRWRYLDIPSDI